MTKARITISLKKGVADPEGTNTRKSLELLGFQGVRSVSTSKTFTIDVDNGDRAEVESQARQMCEKLLANPVIQKYSVEILPEE